MVFLIADQSVPLHEGQLVAQRAALHVQVVRQLLAVVGDVEFVAAGALDALREIGQQPQRSAVFLFVTAEEKGLLGSEYYANNPLYPLETTVSVINVDGAATMGPSRDFGIYGTADVQLLDQLIEVAGRWDVRYTPESKPEAGLFFRSDHFPFAKRGVPAVSYGAGQDLVDGGLEAGRAAAAEYNVNRYHQQADEWQPEWTFAGAVRDLEILYTLGNELANSRQWPAWGPSSQFGELRRASDEQRK